MTSISAVGQMAERGRVITSPLKQRPTTDLDRAGWADFGRANTTLETSYQYIPLIHSFPNIYGQLWLISDVEITCGFKRDTNRHSRLLDFLWGILSYVCQNIQTINHLNPLIAYRVYFFFFFGVRLDLLKGKSMVFSNCLTLETQIIRYWDLF